MPELNIESCCFPSTVKRGKERCNFDTIKLDHLSDHTELSGSDSVRCSQQLLQASWALLLANYLGKESITFAVLSTSSQSDSLETKTSVQQTISDPQILIYQYELSGFGRLENLCEQSYWKTSSEGLREMQINTAVYVSNWQNHVIEFENLFGFEADNTPITDVFDLVLEMQIKPSFRTISLKYRSAVISVQYAQSIAESLTSIVQKALSGNQLEYGPAISLRDEEQEMVLSWNPKTLYSHMNCMQYLVEAAARSSPFAEAVCSWDGSLTYSQLDDLSSLAAHRLGKSGVGPGVYVPFAYEKSLWTVVATLAILKAGGAFVPLDPNHPTSRLNDILASTNAPLVVCSELFAPKFVDMGRRVVVISARTIQLEQTKTISDFLLPIVHPTDPIFVLFTSGSTGKPKGMVHEHGAICTHAIAHGRVMGYQGARVLQFAAHTFDVAIFDIFTTLIFGGCICIPSEEERKLDIIGAINKMKADHAILTPSFARLIRPSDVPSLKTLAVGGEALPQDGLKEWIEKVSLIQIYGPAEVGICLTINMDLNTRSETVGYPLPNCSCWIVDPSNPHRLVPVGAIGELVVAGPSLAREYLNDKPRSRASFLENPPWAKILGLAETRFFRTGDLLRYNTDSFDGSFEFVGRKDAQLKIHGQRVEPGEIEHHIATIPGVAISVVSRPDRGCFSGQLVAIVEMRSEVSSRVRNEPLSLASDQSVSLEQLSSHLANSLPIYMIPTVCLAIRSMPFVPSLKINRKAVEAWLNDLVTPPSEVAKTRILDIRSSPLDPTEFTAIIISNKVAELVAPKDCERRSALSKHDFILQAAGVDSIQIISLSMFFERLYDFKIPMNKLLDSMISIRDLAKAIDCRNDPENEDGVLPRFDIHQEYELSIQSLSEISNNMPNHHLNGKSESKIDSLQNIFVTGATGYLGSRILQALMERPQIVVFAHVRCVEESLGLLRITKSAKELGWWRDDYLTRIRVWCGDLSQEDLGLSSDQLRCLHGTITDPSLRIHGIIHNGAKVHYSSHYESLKPANVQSTVTLLKLTALSKSITTMLFVSGGRNPDDICTIEDLSGPRRTRLNQASGYTQTKLISELLVENCKENVNFSGKELYVTRPGYIIGNSESGIPNQTDFIWRLVAGCVEAGVYNQDESDHWLFISDANWVAESVVAPLFYDQRNSSGTNQGRILDGLRFSELWELLSEDFGYSLQATPFEKWMKSLKAVVLEKQENHLLFPLLNALEMDGGAIGSLVKPAGLSTDSTDRVKNAIRSNIRYLIRTGFMSQSKS